MPPSSTVRFTCADHRSIPEDHRRHELVLEPDVVTGSLGWRVGGREPAELEIPLEEVFRRVG